MDAKNLQSNNTNRSSIEAQQMNLGSTPQTPHDISTLSPTNNRVLDMSAAAQQSTIDHKSMRLKSKINAVGSLGD
jgi:hypothetical protein